MNKLYTHTKLQKNVNVRKQGKHYFFCLVNNDAKEAQQLGPVLEEKAQFFSSEI